MENINMGKIKAIIEKNIMISVEVETVNKMTDTNFKPIDQFWKSVNKEEIKIALKEQFESKLDDIAEDFFNDGYATVAIFY